MKKAITIIAAFAVLALAVSCSKTEDTRPVCTRIDFTVSSDGYSKEILDLFRFHVSGVGFDGSSFDSHGSATYTTTLSKSNARIASSEDHYPVSVKVTVEKIKNPDPEKTYSFPHSFYIQAEFYDANGKKLDVSSFSKYADQKIDRVIDIHSDGGIEYKGDKIEREVRKLEMDETFVFFRHGTQDYFCCNIK